MSGEEFHYVCTLDEARGLIDGHGQFWIANCSCREKHPGGCARSRTDVCLQFRDDTPISGSGKREVNRAFVEGVLQEALAKGLVPRPFRGVKDRQRTDGICFCCDDCCSYFKKTGNSYNQRCDKGRMIELTDSGNCNSCGLCVDACLFGARRQEGDLTVDRDQCYGCGVCVDACPEQCIRMVERT